MYEVVQVLGVDINISRMEQALSEVEALLTGGGRHYVCFMEANMMHCLLAAPDEIAPVLNGAALCYPDGVAVARSAALRLGQPVERVSGPSFVLRACAHGVERGWRHYFVGGGEGVAEALARKLQEQYPGLQVAGTYTPPFRDMSEEEIDALAAQVSASRADLLWVALGGPRQEKWMRRYLGRMPVPVMLGVGAAFDFHTQNQPWAPRWIRVIGMEWLYRACTGGRRVFWRNLNCVSRVALWLAWDRLRGMKYLFGPHLAARTKRARPEE